MNINGFEIIIEIVVGATFLTYVIWDIYNSHKKVFLTFIVDPGHGWLKVPLELVHRLGVEYSPFSYERGEYVYLEEDSDSAAFLNAAKQAGIDVSIETICVDYDF